MSGGLGNQMFQYAFAKAYALKHNGQVALDLSFYQDGHEKTKITPRSFKLNQFRCDLEVTTSTPLWAKYYSSRVVRKLHDILFLPFILKDEEKGYRKSYIENFYRNKLFIGYFQSPQYLMAYRDILLKDFTPKSSLSDGYQPLLEQVRSSESVSLHVRRGDYLLSHNNSIHGVLTLEYYQRAVDFVRSKTSAPTFFIFSDDIDWCKSNLKIESPTIFINPTADSSDRSDIADLILMSNCKHNIIANSSFSWWGAWLNQDPNKIVIAPENWFADKTRLLEWDIFPKDWHIL